MEATRPHRYTAEQRAAALELYSEVGPAEAGRRLGIPSGTVRSWARRNGCAAVATENRRAAVEAARLTWEQRRSGLTVRLGEVAAELLERVEKAEPGEAKALATALAILVDKAELLSGRATERTEAGAAVNMDAEIERLIGELAREDGRSAA
ncbi:MAG: hypothetical protein H0T96_06640 [Thermoleophilaceae bacterium]|nr:hypothetical protein [Thermoleophilaceae bacterium]